MRRRVPVVPALLPRSRSAAESSPADTRPRVHCTPCVGCVLQDVPQMVLRAADALPRVTLHPYRNHVSVMSPSNDLGLGPLVVLPRLVAIHAWSSSLFPVTLARHTGRLEDGLQQS